MRSIILAGFGPHARRIYWRFLTKHKEQYGISVPLVIELESQRTIVEDFLSTQELQPKNVVYLPDDARMGQLPSMALEALESTYRVDPNASMIIATEPKAHMPYALWALEHNVDVLMDKPISAPEGLVSDPLASTQVLKDYLVLEKALKGSSSSLIVQCQRRYHKGYIYVWNYLNEFVKEWGIPITYMDIYHADGMWNMPDEFYYREGHPYKYGYGKLLHSGYHFIDLYAWFSQVNDNLATKSRSTTEVIGRSFIPEDHAFIFNNEDYGRLLNTRFDNATMRNLGGLGELDVYGILQSRSSEEKVINTAIVSLQQNSFSRRAWAELPKDTYKGNGRVRHERFSVQVGPLLNIQIHSYQSHEVLRKDTDVVGVGNEDHFDIYIFRNTGIVGGQAFKKIALGEKMKVRKEVGYMGHNEKAREQCLVDWLNGAENRSDFASHKETNRVLSALYAAVSLGEPQIIVHE